MGMTITVLSNQSSQPVLTSSFLCSLIFLGVMILDASSAAFALFVGASATGVASGEFLWPLL